MREYRRILKRTKKLLNRIEDYEVDFKETIKSLDSQDLVAFANSNANGTILVGVKEIKKGRNKGKGEIVGCQVGDKERLAIINKAESCHPPINVEVFVENADHKPFFRIEIKDNNKGPYCSSSGTYKIRGDGQNKALVPSKLLALFIETQGTDFVTKYNQATKEFEKRMGDILQNISIASKELGMQLDALAETVESTSSIADNSLDSINDSIGEIQDLASVLHRIDDSYPEIGKKLDTIIVKMGIEPACQRIIEAAKRFVSDHGWAMGVHGRKKDKEILEYLKEEIPWLSDEQLNEWVTASLEEFDKQSKSHGLRNPEPTKKGVR